MSLGLLFGGQPRVARAVRPARLPVDPLGPVAPLARRSGIAGWVAVVVLIGSFTAVALTAPADGVRLDRLGWLLILAAIALPCMAIARLAAVVRTHAAKLRDLSRTDHLTTIANSRAWEEELPREAARSRRDGTEMCVAVLDVDGLNAFNELHSHTAGDALVRHVATAWNVSVRDSDFLARLDGGRFGLLLRRCPLDGAVAIVDRLRVCMPEAQTASVGVATWDGREQPEACVARAEAALASAKARGRNRISVATAPCTGADDAGDDWNGTVRRLVERRSVVSVYQPIVDLSSGAVVAYEALARPNAQLVDISVDRMFTAAQRMGLARELDWMCRRAALADVSWLRAGRSLFLNCNTGLLVDPVHRVDQMLLVLAAAGLPPSQLVIEITERELAEDMARLGCVVDAYRRAGFRFAVDDVGEGHSTLEVLAAVRPEFIKVARSLVVEADSVGGRAAICAVVAFARECGASVIAEGIELPHSAALMRSLGVDLAQGYLFGRPAMPAAVAA